MNRKLSNCLEDKTFLSELLATGIFPSAIFTLNCFTSKLVSSLTTIDYTGTITEIDLTSGYCEWKNQIDQQMPSVNIDCVTLNLD